MSAETVELVWSETLRSLETRHLCLVGLETRPNVGEICNW